jgi:hypothetical protein
VYPLLRYRLMLLRAIETFLHTLSPVGLTLGAPPTPSAAGPAPTTSRSGAPSAPEADGTQSARP